MPPALLLLLYLGVTLAPLGLAAATGWPRRPFWDELATGLALAGFAVLLVEFILSGRFRVISNRLGMDATMRFHQLMARVATGLLALHPFLYATPFGDPRPWDPTRRETLDLGGAAALTGIGAWLGLGVLVIAAIWRDRLLVRYEAWRLSHGLGAALVAAFGTHHAIEAGRYSGGSGLAVLWIALLAVALFTLLDVYLLRPWRQLRHPYRIRSLQPVARRTWELVIEPRSGEALRFRAGQFVWLTLDRSAFNIREHPFSIASAPAERDRLAFLIKEAGDFTGQIGDLPVGAQAYVDGPHGGLVLEGRQGRGVVFLVGGVGIAPILAMLRELAARGDGRPLRLLYGNRHLDQVVARAELDAMARRLDLEIVHLLSEPLPGWSGETGQFDAATIRRLCDRPEKADWLYVVCGPPAMIDAVEDALVGLGVPAAQIVSEKFAYG